MTSPDDSDAIVIGAGLSGLACAARLAQAGLRVLLLEQGETIGGYAQSIQRADYTFNLYVDAIRGAGPAGLLQQVLADLGCGGTVSLSRLNPQYTLAFPDFHLVVPEGAEAFAAALGRVFPAERSALQDLVTSLTALASPEREAELAAATPAGGGRGAEISYHDLLTRHLRDPRAIAAAGALWPLAGLPPAAVSARAMAALLCRGFEGMVAIDGGSSRLAAALAGRVRVAGGRVLCAHPVAAILAQDSRARGVRLADGTCLFAPTVVAATDPALLPPLLTEAGVPAAYLDELAALPGGISLFQVLVGADIDIDFAQVQGLTREVWFYPGYDYSGHGGTAVRSWQPADVAAAFHCIATPTAVNGELAGYGKHLFRLAAYGVPRRLPGAHWHDVKDELAHRFISQAGRYVPHLASNIEVQITVTPDDVAKLCGSAEILLPGLLPGATPLAPSTPLRGLYLAGRRTATGPDPLHWLQAGLRTAGQILG